MMIKWAPRPDGGRRQSVGGGVSTRAAIQQHQSNYHTAVDTKKETLAMWSSFIHRHKSIEMEEEKVIVVNDVEPMFVQQHGLHFSLGLKSSWRPLRRPVVDSSWWYFKDILYIHRERESASTLDTTASRKNITFRQYSQERFSCEWERERATWMLVQHKRSGPSSCTNCSTSSSAGQRPARTPITD